MVNCRIFDDQYGKKIYEDLSKELDFVYPVIDNVLSPIPYLEHINDWDIILLDNYFSWEAWEEPLWDKFLEEYLKKWINAKIICISDYWEVLLEKYFNRDEVSKKWDIIWWVPSKNYMDIIEILENFF